MHIYVDWIIYLSNINGDDRSLGSYSFQLTVKSLKFKTFRDETECGYENTNICGCTFFPFLLQLKFSGFIALREWKEKLRCYALGVPHFAFLSGM